MDDLDQHLTTTQAAQFLNVSHSFLEKLRIVGGGPKFLRLSSRKILYQKGELKQWMERKSRLSTSEYNDISK
jgi:hypothetical protein